MFEIIFKRRWARMQHRAAPLLKEREEYLRHLWGLGHRKGTLRVAAEVLLHTIRTMNLTSLRRVSEAEIRAASLRWAFKEAPCPISRRNQNSAQKFFRVTRNWLRFHRMLVDPSPPECWFDGPLADFLQNLHKTRRLAPWTITAYATRMRIFFRWLEVRRSSISAITFDDIDEFIDERRSAGVSPRLLVASCSVLRRFFCFAEDRHWCQIGFSHGIRNPVQIKYDPTPSGPSWNDVRRLIRDTGDVKAADCRARAILLLCAIYGLRDSEVTRLSLGDFDWRNETFIVRRAKRGRTQQFPLQYEVGEAIIRYLRLVRPHCDCSRLFVTLNAPYRPMPTVWLAISRRMRRLGIISKHYGSHALRHACATQLLKKGSSLKDIADFLGHRSLDSVSAYAKHDLRSLRDVANIRLAGIL